MITKFCKGCETEKPAESFSKDRQKRDGLASSCKACRRDYHRGWSAGKKEEVRSYKKSYYAANRERILAAQRERMKNPDLKAIAVATTRRWRAENPERVREHRLRHGYGITPEQIDVLLAAQDGACAICLKPGKLVVDHDHQTGELRSLLHSGCNGGLGMLGDDGDLIPWLAEFFRSRK